MVQTQGSLKRLSTTSSEAGLKSPSRLLLPPPPLVVSTKRQKVVGAVGENGWSRRECQASVAFRLELNATHSVRYTEGDITNAWLSVNDQLAIRHSAAATIRAYRLEHQKSLQQNPQRQPGTLDPPKPLQMTSPPSRANISIDMRGLEHHSTAESNKNKVRQGESVRKAILAATAQGRRAELSLQLSAADVDHAVKVGAVDATTAKIIHSQPIDATAPVDISPSKTLFRNYSNTDQKHQTQQNLVYYSRFSRRRRTPSTVTRKLPLHAAVVQSQDREDFAFVLGAALDMKDRFPAPLQD